MIDKYYMIIDSFYDYVDLLGKNEVKVYDNEIEFIGDLKNTSIINRYSDTSTVNGIDNIKKLYEKQIR